MGQSPKVLLLPRKSVQGGGDEDDESDDEEDAEHSLAHCGESADEGGRIERKKTHDRHLLISRKS